MDLRYGDEYEKLRSEVREFLSGWPLRGAEAQLPPAEQEALFRRRGIERGYVYRHIPIEYGGSGQPSDVIAERLLQEEYARAGAPGNLLSQGAAMLAPTLLEWGTEEQKRRFVPRALTGEDVWCQGYSEPGAGSDLASLTSRAELVGQEWVIHGHKVWTSSAHVAHYMFGLFRTEPDAPPHAGISYLLLDMKAPGVEVRPLREMTGGALFNEVRLDGVRTPAGWIVGRRGEGWKVSRSTLKHERNMIGNPSAMRMLFQGVLELARAPGRGGRPALADPAVRQRLADLEGCLLSQEYTARRHLSANARGEGAKVMLSTLMMKLYGSNLRRRLTELAYDLIGADGLVAPAASELSHMAGNTPGGWTAKYMSALAVAIAGGSSNIQRNIIGERGLGLPRDLRKAGTVFSS